MPQPHKFIFFGTPGVARDTLSLLIERGLIPAAVVTSPDAPRGRGLVLTPSPTRLLANEHAIKVLTPERLDESAVGAISELGCDYALVVAYGKIFPEQLIAAFPKGVLNVHYSLLPKYRGATPLEAALLAGESETGVTVQKMARELDAGDIIAQESTPIAADETARELRPRLIRMGAELLAEVLPAYLSGQAVARAQDHARATRCGKLKKEDGRISLIDDAEANWRKYRAFADTIGTHFFDAAGRRVKIKKASYRNGAFVIERVVPEGKNEMDYIP